MNFSDSEIVASVLNDFNYCSTKDPKEADIVFINTCSIREHAEQRIRNRLRELKMLKRQKPFLLIGLLGCMAERLKDVLLEEEKSIDFIAGPDSYRDLPNLITTATEGKKAINVFLSPEETYADITPLRYENNGISAFISIMRGCENFCSYCVVPYTRGKERSRNPETIINETSILLKNGFKEITLLGQNVNSYKSRQNKHIHDFTSLIEQVAQISPSMRIRFATSHPKDMSDEVIEAIRDCDKVEKIIHLPIQAGSNRILKLMNRGYTAKDYLRLIMHICLNIQNDPTLLQQINIPTTFLKKQNRDVCKKLLIFNETYRILAIKKILVKHSKFLLKIYQNALSIFYQVVTVKIKL